MDFLKRGKLDLFFPAAYFQLAANVFIYSEKNTYDGKEMAPQFFSSFCAIAAVIVFAVALVYNAISYVLDLKKLISDLQDPKEVNKFYLITVYLGLFSQYYPETDSFNKKSGADTMRAICYIHVIFSLIVLLVYLWFFSLKHINLTIAIPAYSFKSIAEGLRMMAEASLKKEPKYAPGWEDTGSLMDGIGNFALLLYIAFVVGKAVQGDAEALTPVLTFSSLTMVCYTMLKDFGFLDEGKARYLGAIFWLCILGDFKKYAILQVVMRSYYQWMYIAGATGINMLHVYHYIETRKYLEEYDRKMYKVVCQILLYVGWIMGLFMLVCMILHILFAKKQNLAQKFTAAASTSV